MDKELALYVADGPDGAVVALSGPLSVRTVPEISGELGKALVNRGCVLVDLSGLRLDWEPGVTVFGTVLGYAGGWPGARMVLFGADGELAAALARSRVTQAVPLVADLLEALQRVQGRPERVRRFRDLPPESGAPGAARAMVHQACVDWEIPIETENAAALVVSELATNAVVHAETTLRLGVARPQLRHSQRLNNLPGRNGRRQPSSHRAQFASRRSITPNRAQSFQH